MRKKIVKISVIVLALFVVGLTACIVVRQIAIGQVSQKAMARLTGTGATFEIEAGWAFWCVDSMKIDFGEIGGVEAEHICLTNPWGAMFGDEVDVAVGKVRAKFDSSDVASVRERIVSIRSKFGNSELKSIETDSSKRYSAVVGDFEISMRSGDDVSLSFRGRDISGYAGGGEIGVDGVLTHKLTGRRLPFSIDSMPEMSLEARYRRAEKSGNASVRFEPALSGSFSKWGRSFSGAISSFEVDWDAEEVRLSVGDASLMPSDGAVLPPVVMAHRENDESNVPGEMGAKKGAETPMLTARGVSIALPRGRFRVADIAAVRIDRPRLSVDLAELLEIPALKENAVVSAFVRFWKQDAGAFLGEAPKLSVRREDVIKNAPKVVKNPLPKEKLEKWRGAIAQFGDRVRALPAIDIREGEIAVLHGSDVFELDAISINTSKMFKESQDFEIHFDVRGADVMFGVSYPEDAALPRLAFRASQLGAPDFLRLLNLPIPEQNSGDVTFDVGLSFSEESVSIDGRLALRDFAFYHEKISPNTIEGIDMKSSIVASYRFADDLVTMDPIEFEMGPLKVHGTVSVEAVRNQPVISFEFSSEKIACASLSEVIPKGFLPTITKLSFEGGEMSPSISGKIPWKYPLTATLKATGFEDKCLPVLVEPHRTEVIAARDFTHTTTYTYFVDSITVGPGTPSYVRLSQLPPYVKAAMMLTEDKRFYEHGPLRVSFIERALRLNLNARRYVYGGSTIGQQLVKNLFLRRTKNIARKLEEALITWHMETFVTKSRILELYINIIEFGPDVYGIEQGAQFYFGKHARDLTPLEGAFLASLKVAPSKGGRFYKNGFPKDGRWWERRQKYILKVLAENGYISPLEVIAAYDWRPQFVYPDDPKDWRSVWLEKYTAYMRDGDKALKRGVQGAENDPLERRESGGLGTEIPD